MISSTFGAPFGGTTRGAHQGVDSDAFSLITPPNFGSGGGSCFPSTVVVALGDPGTPVTCWADTETQPRAKILMAKNVPRTLISDTPIAVRLIGECCHRQGDTI